MRTMPRATPSAMRGWGARRAGVRLCSFGGSSKNSTNNRNVKSEPKYLACEEFPIRAFYFRTISCSSVLSWLPWWAAAFSTDSFMHLASQNTYVAKDQPRSPPCFRRQETSYEEVLIIRTFRCDSHLFTRFCCVFCNISFLPGKCFIYIS